MQEKKLFYHKNQWCRCHYNNCNCNKTSITFGNYFAALSYQSDFRCQPTILSSISQSQMMLSFTIGTIIVSTDAGIATTTMSTWKHLFYLYYCCFVTTTTTTTNFYFCLFSSVTPGYCFCYYQHYSHHFQCVSTIGQGWKMASKMYVFKKTLKTSKVQNLGFLGFLFLGQILYRSY